MKTLLSLLLLVVIGLGVGIGNVFAGPFDREVANEAGYVNSVSRINDGTIISRPGYVYAVTVLAENANTYVKLFDTASGAAPVSETPKIEVGESTQYKTTRYQFEVPVRFENGIYADVTSGSVVVEYR